MYLILVSFLFLFAAILVLNSAGPSRKVVYLVLFGSISAMLLYGFFYVANYFTGNGIDEAVIFHLKAGLGGAGIKEYLGLIIATIVYVLVVSVFSFKVFKRINESSNSRLRKRKILYVVTAFFMVASFVTNPAIKDIYNLTSFAVAGESYSTSEEFPKEFISDSPLIKNKKNIVYIYLESLEATYLDEDIFPGLMPNIKALQQSATTFSNIKQVTHTGWTIAGMTASQCGIPLFSPSHRNSQGLDEFLPEANCLGDILKRNDYHLSYMAGADLSFAGKGNFYQTHSFDSVKGKKQLSQNLKNIENMSGWGLYDDSLFSMLKDEYSRLSKNEKPFGLFSLTLDTHNPNGHISQFCERIHYKDGSNPILNSVHCADVLVNNLVEYIKENPGKNETIIAISSDHYAMKNTAWNDLNKGKRRNLFMVIEPASPEKGKTINKRGSMLDVAPTLLSFLDTPIDGLGFGRNLNADVPSLVEKKKSIDAYLNEHQNVVKYLWSYPKLNNGIHYSLEVKDRLLLGDREVSLPAIFKLNDDANVDEIIFDNYGLKKLGDYMEEMDIGQGFIWADRCKLIYAFARSEKIGESDKDKWCISSGTTGASDLSSWELTDNMTISHTDIKSSLSSNDLSEASHMGRVTGISNILKYGVGKLDTLSVSPESNMVGSVVVRSAGFSRGESYVEQNGKRVKLKRGLTLVGLTDTYAPIKLSHVDSCAAQVVDHATLEDTGSFATVMNNYSESFDTFLVIGHDSVVCNGDRNLLNATLSDIEIKKWSRIGYRQPYIGIISSKGKNKELIGEKEEALVLNVESFTEHVESVEKSMLGHIERIAHAGGGYNGKTYTNSIDALNENKSYYSLFEIDFSWTSDNELVCIHDWKHSFERTFGISTESPVSYNEFVQLVSKGSGMGNCTLSSLALWLENNPGKKIVTDVKEKNIDALRLIAERHPDLKSRFIPQIYWPEEYKMVSELGFDSIIWTLYRFGGDIEDILNHLETMDLYALTMPRGKADAGLAELALKKRGVRSYVHTINSKEAYLHYLDRGVSEIYTDWLH